MKFELFWFYLHNGWMRITLNCGTVCATFDTDTIQCVTYWWPQGNSYFSFFVLHKFKSINLTLRYCLDFKLVSLVFEHTEIR
jgi:hypothetical protein